MKNIVILGSTGSIGIQTLNIVRKNLDKLKVVGLVANSNVSLLKKQADEFKPEYVGFFDYSAYNEAKDLFDKSIRLECGRNALLEAVRLKSADTVVASVVGMCGLESVIESAKNKKDIALANKESLVAGGELVINAVRENNVSLIPVDSEHSAVWQALKGNKASEVSRIILTASGGKFFGKKLNELENVSIEEATAHPNWSMGKKITVDSSTMMNKSLEIIEARWLFDTEKIDYIIHPQSIIHSMVEFCDGSTIAQISNPNMELPISLALGFPNRLNTGLPPFNFQKNLTFFEPDEQTFIFPRLARQALKVGGSAPCVLNSANEAAVQLFLDGKIGFLDIFRIVEKELEQADIIYDFGLFDIINVHTHIYDRLMKEYK